MKKFTALCFIVSSLFLSSCKDEICGCAPPLETQLRGQWKWVRTTTPTKVIIAEQYGISKSITFSISESGDLVASYQSDSLVNKRVSSRTGSSTDEKKSTVLLKFGSEGYVKFYMNNQQSLQTSELMKVYSEKADTVRHFYEFVEQPR